MIKSRIIESYKDYGKVLELSNGVVEVYATLDIGLRIIRFGFVGGQNILNDNRSDFDCQTDERYESLWGKGKHWENFGGHRIWATPEVFPETYNPDDEPVLYELTEKGVILTQKPEPTGLQKQLEIIMDPDDATVGVINRIKNTTGSEKEFSVWGITVAEKGGVLTAPMNVTDTGLLANRIISVWPYTDLSDKRIKFFDKNFVLKQSKDSPRPIKIGFDLECGSVFYALGEDVFCKSFEVHHREGLPYPDGGCSFETYTNENFLEIESLSPVKKVAPGETVSQRERWTLTKAPANPDFDTESGVNEFLSKI